MPGQALEIQITFNYSGSETLTALGLQETLPANWVYTGLGSGATPALGLQSDAVVEFLWISPPAFPATYSYFVTPPANASGDQVITGDARYRLSGPELVSANVETVVPGPRPDPEFAVLAPIHDATLYESDFSEAFSNGGGEYFFAGYTGEGIERRGLVQFDVAGTLPPGATVLSARLVLNLTRTADSGDTQIQLLAMEEPWTEGTANAPGNEGQGTAPQSGDSTWNYRAFQGIVWFPGALIPGFADAALLVNGIGEYEWNSEFLADRVQIWLQEPSNNFGWMLYVPDNSAQSARQFASRENPAEGLRPRLIVEYLPASR